MSAIVKRTLLLPSYGTVVFTSTADYIYRVALSADLPPQLTRVVY